MTISPMSMAAWRDRCTALSVLGRSRAGDCQRSWLSLQDGGA
jgi:hypothetical protein